MNLGILAKRAGQFAADKSPAILTAVGVTGALTTAYLTGKATLKAAEILAEAESNDTLPYLEGGTVRARIEDLTFQEKAGLVWKQYIPAAGTALVTIACIVAANHIGTRRAAALATAYNLAEKAALEYKDKVVETIGKKKEQVIRDAMAHDEVERNPIGRSPAIVTGNGTDLYRDSWSGRYFDSSREHIERAVNAINFKVNNEFYASLTDLYHELGLESTAESDEIGWNSTKLLEVHISYAANPEDRPCGVIEYRTIPVRNYTSAF